MALLEFTDIGIYCRAADVYIDPWRKVDRAIITHAHADHSRSGMGHYLAHPISEPVMRLRLGKDINVQTAEYGETTTINGVKFTFYPAGHIPGSAQVKAEGQNETWVVTGDYKLEDDGLSTAWEPVACSHFITESTFGLPIYKWQPQAEIFADINRWWASNAAEGICTVIFAYSLGKAQRVLAHLDRAIGPVLLHGAVYNTNQALAGHYPFLATFPKVEASTPKELYRTALIVAPPAAYGTPWLRKMAPLATGVCSGWMAVRGARRRRNADRGFVLSDHADWTSLNEAVRLTGAQHIYATHGYTASYARYLREAMPGIDAHEVHTLFGGDEETDGADLALETESGTTESGTTEPTSPDGPTFAP